MIAIPHLIDPNKLNVIFRTRIDVFKIYVSEFNLSRLGIRFYFNEITISLVQ